MTAVRLPFAAAAALAVLLTSASTPATAKPAPRSKAISKTMAKLRVVQQRRSRATQKCRRTRARAACSTAKRMAQRTARLERQLRKLRSPSATRKPRKAQELARLVASYSGKAGAARIEKLSLASLTALFMKLNIKDPNLDPKTHRNLMDAANRLRHLACARATRLKLKLNIRNFRPHHYAKLAKLASSCNLEAFKKLWLAALGDGFWCDSHKRRETCGEHCNRTHGRGHILFPGCMAGCTIVNKWLGPALKKARTWFKSLGL